jgi:bifunctional UDP-N-acetylglucosamine pyrophosphorylase/glucosamine-1-phosphate N-acetyltransferase
MSFSDTAAVILAAGKGTRMKSGKAKVLHELFFKPMLHHVLDSVAGSGIEQVAVIVGHQRQRVLDSLAAYSFTSVTQEEQLGTGHAVLCAESACSSVGQVMILCGDTPLIRPETLEAMVTAHEQSGSVLTLMTTMLDDPFGYGRVISDADNHILEIVEQKDASAEQQEIKEINAGIYLVDAGFLFTSLKQVGTDNSQGEVYLTDVVAIAAEQGYKVNKFLHSPAIDVLGVNSRVELSQAHTELQLRHNRTVMLSGVSMYSPETILVSPDSSLGRDCTVQAGVQISGASTVGSNVELAAGVVLQGSTVGDNAVIDAHSVLRNSTVAPGEYIPPLTGRVN